MTISPAAIAAQFQKCGLPAPKTARRGRGIAGKRSYKNKWEAEYAEHLEDQRIWRETISGWKYEGLTLILPGGEQIYSRLHNVGESPNGHGGLHYRHRNQRLPPQRLDGQIPRGRGGVPIHPVQDGNKAAGAMGRYRLAHKKPGASAFTPGAVVMPMSIRASRST